MKTKAGERAALLLLNRVLPRFRVEAGELERTIERPRLVDDRFGVNCPLRLYGRSSISIHTAEKGT